eukprot:TRINITY_DN9230_c0_g3_i1.p1 TRINITY_DN9230_c0_g3~~TRINITY_DN9230_c0_g3_i1.p1  ORF type:complete len:502 (-),score=140.70 TRINITY_DN9230_c0_g3_i1:474-1979(-)
MGGAATKPSSVSGTKTKRNDSVVRTPESQSLLEEKIVRMLNKKKKEIQEKNRDFITLNLIMLRFPKIRAAFISSSILFQQFDEDHNGTIERDELLSAFSGMVPERAEQEGWKEDILELFDCVDMNGDEKLQFREFLACLAVGFVLDLLPDLEQTGDNSSEEATAFLAYFKDGKALKEAFNWIVEFYISFDDDCNGVIDKKEFLGVIHKQDLVERTKMSIARVGGSLAGADEGRAGPGAEMINEQLFSEADCNGDGVINFVEFLVAFALWVGLEDEQEELIMRKTKSSKPINPRHLSRRLCGCESCKKRLRHGSTDTKCSSILSKRDSNNRSSQTSTDISIEAVTFFDQSKIELTGPPCIMDASAAGQKISPKSNSNTRENVYSIQGTAMNKPNSRSSSILKTSKSVKSLRLKDTMNDACLTTSAILTGRNDPSDSETPHSGSSSGRKLFCAPTEISSSSTQDGDLDSHISDTSHVSSVKFPAEETFSSSPVKPMNKRHFEK